MARDDTREQPARNVFNSDPFEHEDRCLLTRDEAREFFKAVGRWTAIQPHDQTRSISYTRTTYFDTDDLAYLRSFQTPVARRLRIREYALAASLDEPPVSAGLAFVELKESAGTRRSKVRVSLSPELRRRLFEAPRGVRSANIHAAERNEALDTIESELRLPGMEPRLTTWYRRTCLVGEDGRIRVTLDQNITFYRPQTSALVGGSVRPDPADKIAAGPEFILEIKRWGEQPSWLATAIERLRPAPRFSKFQMGMIAILSGVAPTADDPRDPAGRTA